MFHIKEKIDVVKAIPDQMRNTFLIAVTSLIVAIAAMLLTFGMNHAH